MAARLAGYLVVAIVATTFIAGLIVGAQRDDNDGPVDLIVQNAAVYTADNRGTVAEAVAVRGNQILRVGSNREIARLRRPQTVVVDAEGGTVLPGFNDAHLHLIDGGLSLDAIDLGTAATASETLDLIREWAEARPEEPVVVGRGWAPEQFRNGVPSRQLLDSVIPDRPAVMYGADNRSIWVNSPAMRLAGITRRTPDPAGGVIVRDARSGEPTGVLQGSARELLADLIPVSGRAQRAAALRAAIAEANSLGITSVQTSDTSPDALELYDELRRSGELTLRIYSSISVTAPLNDEALARLDEIREKFADDPLLKTGALVLPVDGTLSARSAALLDAYPDQLAGADGAGRTLFAPDDLNRTVRLADAAGWQVIARAVGDRAVREALNAFAHAVRSNDRPPRGRRHRVEGIALVDPVDLPRFGPLGIVASVSPWRPGGGSDPTALLTRHLGPARAARGFPFRELADATRLVLGSGWPDYDLDPIAVLRAATAEPAADPTAEEGQLPARGLPLRAALDAYTSSAAWASFDDQRKGSITPGMLADMVVLSEDIFKPSSRDLKSVSVVTTIFDGRIVYGRGAAETAPAQAVAVPQ